MIETASVAAYRDTAPRLSAGAWVHPSANVIGDVVLGENASVWCGAVVRGDVNAIRIGRDTNIQDLCVLHVSHRHPADPGGAPVTVGDRVTVGHGVILHGCAIGDECLIGMGSLVMDKAVLAPRVLLGAGSLVPEGKRLEGGYLYLGRPAKPIRPLTAEEIAYFADSARHYVVLQRNYG